MVRPAESTRHAIIKAAVDLFADKGFEGASVRDIVTKARVNQAAITCLPLSPKKIWSPPVPGALFSPWFTCSLRNFSPAR